MGTTDRAARLRRRGAAASLALLTAALAAGCTAGVASPGRDATSAGPDCGTPAQGAPVVVLVSGTAHEPRPTLTAQAEQELRDAAAGPAADGRGAAGAVAMVVGTDGGAPEVLPLTPRRDNCAVEHGLQRDALIERNVERVRARVEAHVAARPGFDLLEGLDRAVAGRPAGRLVVVSNGLSTDGAVDLRKVGWHEDPTVLVRELDDRGLVRGLLPGWTVLLTGLGETAGDQPPLTKPARDALVGYWSAICRHAVGAGSCTVDRTPSPPLAPSGTAPVPVVPVDAVSSVVGPDGRVTETVSGSVLFAGDSTVPSERARDVLRGVTDRIRAKLAGGSGATVTIRGFVADPPRSTPDGRIATADARARAVADLVADGLAGQGTRIDARGVGTPPGQTAVVDGLFSESAAAPMRTVTITY